MQNPNISIDYSRLGINQKNYFFTGKTLPYKFRIKQLTALKESIKNHEGDLMDALYKDLRKPAFEAFTHEVGFIYKEIDHTIKELKSWMAPRDVRTELVLQPASSKIYFEPKGVVLIYGPYNYPFQLLIGPMIGAMAAGNCIILKPSELSTNTETVIKKIISSTFPSEYIDAVTGPGEIVGPALQSAIDFDHIFFTGSTNVGKMIMRQAAEKLTPVSLELGGKSPCIVHESARIDHAVKKIIWGKTINLGQSCVAPDYVLIHESKEEAFISSYIRQMDEMLGKDPQQSKDYGRMINENRFDAVVKLMDGVNIRHGGHTDKGDLYIQPTLITDVKLDDAIMQTEVFGPLLPIVTYKNEEEILPILRRHPDPLACYIFSTDHRFQQFIIKNFGFGGGSINNTMSHLGVGELPFGGRGTSGIGAYHGKSGFMEFSHKKPILKMPSIIDVSTLYAPYTNWKYKLSRFFLK